MNIKSINILDFKILQKKTSNLNINELKKYKSAILNLKNYFFIHKKIPQTKQIKKKTSYKK